MLRINGLSLHSPEKALEAYTKLKQARELKVELRRQREPLTLRIILRA